MKPDRFDELAKMFQQNFWSLDGKFDKSESRMQQLETKNSNIEEFVTKLSNSFSELQAQLGGSIPSNTVMNPKSLNAINLRSGKTLDPAQSTKRVQFETDIEEDEPVDEEIVADSPPLSLMRMVISESSKERDLLERRSITMKEPVVEEAPKASTSLKRSKLPSVHEHGESSSSNDLAKSPAREVTLSKLPFPHAFIRSRKRLDDQTEKEMLELFGKLHVNVPFFQLVKSMPSYCKFLKELCTNKRKFRPNE